MKRTWTIIGVSDGHRGRILAALGRDGEAAPLLRAAAERRILLAPHARQELDRLNAAR